MGELDVLLELQAADTSLDQLRSARQRLPERERRDAVWRTLAEVRSERQGLEQRAAELESELSQVESEGDQLAADRDRLEAHLRTVIAPREAEALQKEIALLSARRSELDDRGLELLDELGTLQSSLAELAAREVAVAAELAAADAELTAAEGEIDRQMAEVDERRAALAAATPPARLATYEHLRASHGGVAVSRLDGGRCGGCHLDLSRSELEALRAVPEDEAGECPNCGRLLLR
jgi:predicted  nucleic acid-binding Zn-ribbon protein